MSHDDRYPGGSASPKKTMMGWNASHPRVVPAHEYRGRGNSRVTTDAETIVDERFGARMADEIAAGVHAPTTPVQQQYSAPPQQFSAPPQQYSAPPQPQYSAPPQQQYSAPPQQQFQSPHLMAVASTPEQPAFQQPPPQNAASQQSWQAPNYGQPHQPQAPIPSFVQAEFAQGTSEKDASKNRPIAAADATAGQSQRVRFIRLTYLHLLLAILAFSALEYLFLRTKLGEPVVKLVFWPMMKLGGRAGWAVILAAFVGGGYVADQWSRSNTSRGMQYAGLGFYVLLEALIFIPLLVLAEMKASEYALKYGSEAYFIRDAAVITLALFGGLTASVFLSKKDFSFLRSGLFAGAGVAAGLIVMSLVFGFQLGMIFSAAMIVLAGGYVLYYTSQVLAHYRPTQHVAASLALFSALALMFWYVLRLLMKLRE